KQVKRSHKKRKKAPVAILVIILILIASFTFFLFYSPFEDEEEMSIDGDFEDWRDMEEYSFQIEEVASRANIQESSVTVSNERLFFYTRTETDILVGDEDGNMDSFYFFIDIPGEKNLGHYQTPKIEANHLVKVQGWEDDVFGSIYRYENGSDERNWNGWEAIGDIHASKVGNKLEFSIPNINIQDEEGVRVDIVARDSTGIEAYSDHMMVPGKPSLSINQYSPIDDHVISSEEDILVLNLTARGGDVSVDDISFQGAFESKEVDIDYPFVVEKDESIDITVNGVPSASPGDAVNLQVEDVDTDASVTITGEPRFYYFEEVPDEARIDGVFGDWEDVKDHGVDTDLPSNLDINEYGYLGEHSSFYLKTRGNILKGTAIPEGIDVYSPEHDPEPVDPEPVVERVSGEDEIIFYFDEDGSGILSEGTNADKKVVLRGQYGEIVEITSYSKNGNGWVEEEFESKAARWYNQIEVELSDISLESAVINTLNWREQGDSVVLSPYRSVMSSNTLTQESFNDEISEVLIAYGISGGDFEYSWWTDEGWNESEGGEIGGPEIQWLINKQSPVQEEKILAAQIEDPEGNVHILANVWNGTGWTGVEPIAMNIGGDSTHRVLDVAYESMSGDGHIFYYNTSADGDSTQTFFNYKTWDPGSESWSEEYIYELGRTQSQIDWIQTSSSPTSDDVAIFLTAYNTQMGQNHHRTGLIWNGNEMIDEQGLDDQPIPEMNGEIFPCMDVIFNSTGSALFTWAREGSSDVFMRGWGPVESWDNEFSYGIGGEGKWISLASDPNGDGVSIAVSYETENAWPLKTFEIENNGVISEETHDQDIHTLENRCFDLLYDSSVQDTIILVWGTQDQANPVYRRYYEGTWSEIGDITYENVSYPDRIQLTQDTRGDIFMVAMMGDFLASWTYNSTEESWDFQMEHTKIISGIDNSLRLEPFMISSNIPEFTGIRWFLAVLLCVGIPIFMSKKKDDHD
ncbi:MAG: hypothetical protein R6W73_02650, partial [Candidatus Saliniplasma sp.]